MIQRGEETGAWPVSIRLEKMVTSTGLAVPGSAVVARYLTRANPDHTAPHARTLYPTDVCHGPVGDRYKPLDPKEWRATVEAAVKAGAKPAGAFALNGGARILATFEIPGGNDGTGLRNYLCLVDSLDGSLVHLAGGTMVRVVCANTLQAAMGGTRGRDAAKQGFATVRHTASINDRAQALRGAIEQHIKSGEEVRELYKRARDRKLARKEAELVFDALFPASTEEQRKDNKRKATMLDNARADAQRSAARAENNEGDNLATLWNAATWMVDRTVDGKARPCRGDADKLDSMLFGSRGKRVEEVRSLIEVVLTDGTTAMMEAAEAAQHGVSVKSPLEEMLDAL
jgi:hypothetical protein